MPNILLCQTNSTLKRVYSVRFSLTSFGWYFSAVECNLDITESKIRTIKNERLKIRFADGPVWAFHWKFDSDIF